MKRKITVYVRSMRVMAGETLVEELYPVKRASRAYEISKDTVYQIKLKKKYSYVLPDDHKEVVEVVNRLSERHGLEVKIIDVTKENVIYRLWSKLKGIKNFPILENNLGHRLQAPFSQSELEKFISKSA